MLVWMQTFPSWEGRRILSRDMAEVMCEASWDGLHVVPVAVDHMHLTTGRLLSLTTWQLRMIEA